MLPPQDEDAYRARLIPPVNAALFVLILVSLAANLFFHTYQTLPMLLFGMAILGLTYWLGRAGHIRLAALLLCYTFLAVVSLLLVAGNGIHDISILIFPMVLLLGSVLLDRRRYIVLSAVSVGVVVGITLAEINGVLATPFGEVTDPADLVILSAMLAATAWAVRFLADHITRSVGQTAQLAREQDELIRETNRRAEHLSTLNQIAAAVTSGLDLEKVLSSLYERVQAVVPNDAFSVALYDHATRELSFPLFVDLGRIIYVPTEEVRDHPGLTGEVMISQKTLYLPDLHDPETAKKFEVIRVGDSATRAYLGVPLFLQDEVIGVMSVQSQEPGYFDPDQVRLLETVANHAAIAIQNARLFASLSAELDERRRIERALQERDRILETVSLAAGKFLSEPDWRASFRATLQQLGEETGASHTYIFTVEPIDPNDTSQGLQALLNYEWYAPGVRPLRENPAVQAIPLIGAGVQRWLNAMLKGEAFQCTLLDAEPTEEIYFVQQNLRSYLNSPIWVGGVFWGFIGLDDVNDFRIWSEPEVDAMQIASGLISAAVQRQRDDAQIHRLNADLESRVRERTADLESFAYSVAHDLRAPLRGIDGYSKLLLDEYGGSLDDNGREYLSNVRTAAQWMGQLIEDLLKLSRVTRIEMHTTRVDLSRMAGNILSTHKASSNGRCVIWNVQPELSAEGDPNLIYLAMDNLLSNAWKFTGRRLETQIEFGSAERDGRRVFFVRDNGIGFDMRYANMLFNPFQRLNPGEFEGTGIGLTTVKRIIQRHGGEIWAESQPDQGATFYFTLPN